MTKNYAVINGNTVVNIIVADSKTIAEKVTNLKCVESDGSFGIGWIWDGENWVDPNEETVIDETNSL